MKIEKLSSGRRLKNAAKKSGLFLLLALASLPIPVMHFVLVPVFFLLALVMGGLEYRKNIEVSDWRVACENCKCQVDMSTRLAGDLAMKYCSECNHQVSERLPAQA